MRLLQICVSAQLRFADRLSVVAGAAAEVQKPYHDPWTAGIRALSQALIVYLLALGRCATDLIDHVPSGLDQWIR